VQGFSVIEGLQLGIADTTDAQPGAGKSSYGRVQEDEGDLGHEAFVRIRMRPQGTPRSLGEVL